MDRLEALLRDYVSSLPSHRPIRVLPALLHAMDAIDALAAAGVARVSIAAAAEVTLAPLAAARAGAARRICVPVERVYRAIALANAATGSSPELRAAYPAQLPRQGQATQGHDDVRGGSRTTATSGTRSPEMRAGSGSGASALTPATAASLPRPSRPGAAPAAPEGPAQRVLGELRRQSESRRLPAREPFDPFTVDTKTPAGRGSVEEE